MHIINILYCIKTLKKRIRYNYIPNKVYWLIIIITIKTNLQYNSICTYKNINIFYLFFALTVLSQM